MTSYAVIGATTNAEIAAVAAAGCTHNVVVAFWDQLQPGGAGAALDSTALSALNTVIGYNIANGLQTILEHALHYPPSWVASAVEPFKDQDGNEWTGTSGNGDQVRNWMWTSLGRTYVADFLNSSEGIQLNRAFVKITDPKVRRRVLDLVKALAADSTTPE